MRIGHSSIDENNKAKNGKAGDQTGKEVCIREWYSKPWDYVLRCIDSDKAELMAKACESGCANNNIGYDQNQRNTLRSQAILNHYDLSKIVTPCECDCSSFMSVCAECAGISVPYNGSNAPTTSTMKKAFMSTGLFEYLTDKKYTTQNTYLKRGDILVKSGSHTVMVLDDGIAPEKKDIHTQYGIDVSEYQKKIDWSKIKNAGIQFAVLRCIKRGNLTDATFEYNLSSCITHKIDYSAYSMSYALNRIDSKEHAKAVVKQLNGRRMMIWLDMEWKTQRNSCTKQEIEQIILAFITECGLHGYDVGIYCNYDWYKNVLTDKIKNNYSLWIAKYPKKDTGVIVEANKPQCKFMVWQYSQKGKIAGITTDVDRDVMYC